MFRRSAFALALLVLGGGDAASAVTFSSPFEKTLSAGLATLAQDLQALPKLQPAVVGVPLDVAGWAALSQDDIFAKLTLLSTQKADAVQYLMMDAPASRAQVDKFMADSNQLILAFADAIEAGECVTATEPVALKGGAAPSSSGDASAAPVAAAPSGTSAPAGSAPAPGSTPAPAAAGGAASPSKAASGPAAPVSAPAQPSKVAGGSGVVTSPASGAVSVQGTATASKSTSGAATGVATGVSTAGTTPSAAAAVASSTPAATNSTGVSAVSLSIAMDGNSTDSSSNSDAAVGANGSVDANSAKSTPVQALTPTAGSASLVLSTAAAAVFFAACALAV